MCLIGFNWQPGRDQRLLVAANRDEFHGRPTAPLSRWGNHHRCYAGRDLQAGGTWLAVDIRGRFAAVTNVREPPEDSAAGRSRGALVAEFMASESSAADHVEQIWQARDEYAGFNLLLADADDCLYVSNRHERIEAVRPGNHALSNAALDTAWPKTETALGALQTASNSHHTDPLWAMLMDRRTAPDTDLPETGVPLDWERRLSAPFIAGDEYGTRSSTILSISDQQINIEERRFGAGGQTLGWTRVELVPKDVLACKAAHS